MNDKKLKTNERIALRASIDSIGANVFLSLAKLFAGIFAKSSALISDAVHSIADVLDTIIVIIGIKLSSKAPDEKHQYGHERLECVAAIILSVILFATGLGIGYEGVASIIIGEYLDNPAPGVLALVVAILSIAIKEFMYWHMRSAAKRINSGAMMADAWHQRADALSSVGSLIGVLGARMGAPILDPIISVLICAFIIKAALHIFMDAVKKITDEACDKETSEKIRAFIQTRRGVLGIDSLKTRVFGDRIYVDVEILADDRMTLSDAHIIAEAVHSSIEKEFPSVKHCSVQVNPFKAGKEDQSQRNEDGQ